MVERGDWELLLRLAMAFVAGALVGIEREHRDKPAGLRTHMLVSGGAAMFTLASLTLGAEAGAGRDPTRIAAQIVTGVGFLGAGAIFRSGSDIVGADGAVDTDELGLSAEDIRRERGAGADIGDANLDSDTDASGTGERAEAGRDTLRREAPDIAPDHVEGGSADELLDDELDSATDLGGDNEDDRDDA